MRIVGAAGLVLMLALTACSEDGGEAGDDPTPIEVSSSAPSPSEKPTEEESSEATPSEKPSTSDKPTEAPSPTEEPSPTEMPSSGHGGEEAPAAPTSYAEAVAHIDATGIDGSNQQLARFSTPRDVIYCLLDDPVIGPTCELRSGFIPSRECEGMGDGVGRIETYEGKVQAVCNTDTIREPGAPTIQPLGVVTSGKIRCAVSTQEAVVTVTCIDTRAKHGFFLAPDAYAVF